MRIVTIARKPCASSSTTANVVEHEAGALNIDGSRVGNTARSYKGSGVSHMRYSDGRAGLTDGRGREMTFTVEGRWPANLVVVGTKIRELLDAQSGQLTSGTGAVKRASSKGQHGNRGAAYGAESRPDGAVMVTYGDTGGASRYYKCFEDGDQSE